jgi:hypothetical protein
MEFDIRTCYRVADIPFDYSGERTPAFFDKIYVNGYKQMFKSERTIEITNEYGDLDRLLTFAFNGNLDGFMFHLKLMSSVPTHFVFPSSLTNAQRWNIHKMQTHSKVRFYKSFTIGGTTERNLNIFTAI